jgi:hypothetical protein
MKQIQYSKLERFLRHRDFILYVAIICTFILAPNTYWVYYSMMKGFAPVWREIISGLVALIGVTFGILIYTVHGNIKVANYYMWFEIAISTFYYVITIGWSPWLFPAFCFVFMLPLSLKHYTTELNKDKEFDQSDNLVDKINILEKHITDLHLTNSQLQLALKYSDKGKDVNPIENSGELKDKQKNLSDMSDSELMQLADNKEFKLPSNLF